MRFTVPPDHYLYADQLAVTVEGADLAASEIPPPARRMDAFSGDERDVYEHDVALRYGVTWRDEEPARLTIAHQGCSHETCFLPARTRMQLSPSGAVTALSGAVDRPAGASRPADWRSLADQFVVAADHAGYMGEKEFLEFLDLGVAGKAGAGRPMLGSHVRRGVIMTVVSILLGGLALNLTPCVLPLIPVNLAIIGAGARAKSRMRGFAIGTAYGLGIALAYGVLGLVVVLGAGSSGL